MDILAAHGEGVSSTAAAGVEALLQLREDILKRIESTPTRITAIKTRFHGDYHLGQVLLAENDFVIIDFEGEPARPLSERRTKHSPRKDVAGMLRSFNYAAYATLYEVTAENPNDLPVLEPFVNEWERKAARAFLNGYERAIDGCPVLPKGPQQARSVIDLFTMEKAFYEVRYELNNRPDWIRIPVRGILALFRDQGESGEST
jgi:maltose alpha-D-glucosyltransferase / alpha-amylase